MNRFFRLCGLGISIVLGLLAVLNCGLAVSYPMEMELREGTSWLHVLAMKAGISLYDHHAVAFINMNHGPLDPILKYWISSLLPWLPSQVVVRFFVPIVPVGVYLALRRARGGGGVGVLLGSASLYLFLLNLQPFHLLVGRSDPAALFFFCLFLVVAAPNPTRATQCASHKWRRSVIGGLLAAATVLLNSRFAAPIGISACAFLAETAFAAHEESKRVACRTLSVWVVSGAFAYVAFAWVVCRGDFHLYYLHFFGFFSAKSGWGPNVRPPMEATLMLLVRSRYLSHAAWVGLLGLSVIFPSPTLSSKRQLASWLVCIVGLDVASAWIFYLNSQGGGLYYYAPFYIFAGFYVARAIDWERLSGHFAARLIPLLALVVVPWLDAYEQIELLVENSPSARNFNAQVALITEKHSVYSEQLFLFQHRYEGERVDCGDAVARVIDSGYFGTDFDQTAEKAFDSLRSEPPEFIMTGGLFRPELRRLLDTRYTPVVVSTAAFLANSLWSPPAVYKLDHLTAKTAPAKPKTSP